MAEKNRILIVDDNIRAYRSLSINFKTLGYITEYAANSSEAWDALSNKYFELVLLDLMLGDEDSRDLLDRIVSQTAMPPVVMITGFASIDSAVDSIKRGAFDYVQKPVDFDELLKIVEKALKRPVVTSSGETDTNTVNILENSNSALMQGLLKKARKLATTNLPILILGENGTGKELMAEYIHNYSGRSKRSLHKINCAAFQESILDNELFGHNKGAYTGADEDYKGIFELSDGETLFMDEVGDMSLAIQAKILRTLQNNEIRRIGGTRTISVDVRFIAATNKDLEKMIAEKTFRKDLYYRLCTAIIEIPALRERPEDITLLAQAFLDELSGGKDFYFTDEVLALLEGYSWPGNVRELKNAVQYAFAICNNNEITVEDLPGSIKPESEEAKQAYTGSIREKAERDIIIATLNEVNNNKSRAAEKLEMSRKTLYSKIERYGIRI